MTRFGLIFAGGIAMLTLTASAARAWAQEPEPPPARTEPRVEPAPAPMPPPAPMAIPREPVERSSAEQGERRHSGKPRDARTDSDEVDDPQPSPRHSRPRGDRPASGQAVPREASAPPPSPRYVYWPSSSYRYSSYPYGYGSFGLGYFYYDPFWYDPFWSSYQGYGYPRAYGGYGYSVGGLRLKVKPQDAEVLIDGYFVGRVDDFDGIWQRLTLDAGPYRIEIRAPGHEPLVINVRIQPGDTMTYRGRLRPIP